MRDYKRTDFRWVLAPWYVRWYWNLCNWILPTGSTVGMPTWMRPVEEDNEH